MSVCRKEFKGAYYTNPLTYLYSRGEGLSCDNTVRIRLSRDNMSDKRECRNIESVI